MVPGNGWASSGRPREETQAKETGLGFLQRATHITARSQAAAAADLLHTHTISRTQTYHGIACTCFSVLLQACVPADFGLCPPQQSSPPTRPGSGMAPALACSPATAWPNRTAADTTAPLLPLLPPPGFPGLPSPPRAPQDHVHWRYRRSRPQRPTRLELETVVMLLPPSTERLSVAGGGPWFCCCWRRCA